MPGTHNVDQLYNDIHDFVDGFNFTTQVEVKSLALDCAGVIADGIIARSIDDQSAAEGSWDALNEKYKEWKVKKYGVGLIGVRTGQMLSLNSVLGEIEITPELATVLYGKALADPEDDTITDIEKAYFFSERRPFFELDDKITDELFARIEELLETYLRKGA
jgi:hypothetical protein